MRQITFLTLAVVLVTVGFPSISPAATYDFNAGLDGFSQYGTATWDASGYVALTYATGGNANE